MKIKFHWGIGIAIVYSAFVLFMIGNVLFSTLQRSDLVEEDYYDHELEYQKHIDNVDRTKKLINQLEISRVETAISLKFPEQFKKNKISGTIHFYKPSNSSYDKKFPVKLNSDNFQLIDFKQLSKIVNSNTKSVDYLGFWKIKVDWTVNDSGYYNEESIVID